MLTAFLFKYMYLGFVSSPWSPITVSQGAKGNTMIPYWICQILIYATIFLLLPLLCGLMPFESPSEWSDHFLLLIVDPHSNIGVNPHFSRADYYSKSVI